MQTNNKLASIYLVMGIVLLSLFGILSFGIETNQSWTTLIDDIGRHIFQSHISDGLTNFIIKATEIGNMRLNIALTIIVVLILFVKKHFADGLWLGGTVLFGAAVATTLLKNIFDRARPEFLQLVEKTSESYPSGHATGTTVFYGMLIIAAVFFMRKGLKRLLSIALCTFIILFVLITRIYLGVHYPTDVIGGFLLGSAAVCISVGIYILVKKPLVHSLAKFRLEDESLKHFRSRTYTASNK